MRLLKFFGVFLLTAIVVFGFVFGLNWKSFTTFFDNREAMIEGNEWVHKTNSLKGLSEYMGANPEHASVASIVISNPDSSIYFRENTPRTMGTTSNIFILIAYSMKIESGELNENEPILWEDISRFQLPGIDESVHNEAYRAADNRGWIDVNEAISTNYALKLLAEFNPISLSDYLWWNISPEIWNEIPEAFNLENTEMPLPFSGLYIAISPGIQESTNQEILDHNKSLSESEWREKVANFSDEYANNSDRRDFITSYISRNRLGNTFIEERDAMILFPKTTAREITSVLQTIVSNQFSDEKVSERIKNYLRWPMERQSGIERDFEDYGSLYENRMGLLAGIDFGVSAYTGDTTVQALFLDQLPIGFWFHASGGHMHQDLMQRLIFDPAMIEQMKYAVKE